MPLNPLSGVQRYPLPGTSSLYPLDRISILQRDFPLKSLDGGIELDVEKRKEPGSDFSSYVSHGLDSVPIRIVLMLFRDIWTKKDWMSDFLEIQDQLVARSLNKRNAIPVFHPWLNLLRINEIIFTKQSFQQHERGQIFNVTLEGFNPRQLRVGSGTSRLSNDLLLVTTANPLGIENQKSKPVGIDKQSTNQPTARQNSRNYTMGGRAGGRG